jgi:hypothetical protein
MRQVESKLLRVAVGVGAVIWIARMLLFSRARRDVEDACLAVDEAVRLTALRGRGSSADCQAVGKGAFGRPDQ